MFYEEWKINAWGTHTVISTEPPLFLCFFKISKTQLFPQNSVKAQREKRKSNYCCSLYLIIELGRMFAVSNLCRNTKGCYWGRFGSSDVIVWTVCLSTCKVCDLEWSLRERGAFASPDVIMAAHGNEYCTVCSYDINPGLYSKIDWCHPAATSWTPL